MKYLGRLVAMIVSVSSWWLPRNDTQQTSATGTNSWLAMEIWRLTLNCCVHVCYWLHFQVSRIQNEMSVKK